jgi:hypothetical protein
VDLGKKLIEMRGPNYTPEDDQYLREHYADTPTVDIAKRLDRRSDVIRYHANKLNLHKSKEQLAVNMFRTALRDRDISKIGDVSEFKKKEGKYYLMIKTETGWIPLHHYNWILENGIIPEGMRVTFKDGDNRNCDITNLELITQKENMKRNSIHSLYPVALVNAIFTLGILKRKIKEHGE